MTLVGVQSNIALVIDLCFILYKSTLILRYSLMKYKTKTICGLYEKASTIVIFLVFEGNSGLSFHSIDNNNKILRILLLFFLF